MIELKGKSIAIAGGSSGAGLAVAVQAAREGATVHLIGRSTARLEKARLKVEGTVHTHALDIANEPDIAMLRAEIGQLDHLVTTAADLTFKPLLELSNAEIDRMLASKFWGPIHLVRHFAPVLSMSGSITFVGGSAAYKASAGASVVAAANAALAGLARTLALELAPVRVNVVSPGVFDGGTWDFLPAEVRSPTLREIGSGLPIGRVGTAEEVADAILFFVRNGFATGTVLPLDGGADA